MKRSIETFTLPGELKSLTKKDADIYFKTILTTAPFLGQEVIKPIRESLKRETGYDDEHPPKKKDDGKEQKFNIEETTFIVKTIISDKKPSYASIFGSLYDYLYFAEEHVRLGIGRDDLISRGKRSYIRADILAETLTNLRERITEKGIKQEISCEPALIKVPEKIVVPIVDYSKLPSEAAKLPEFEAFLKELNKRALDAFENLLKKGVDKAEWKEINNYLFHICKIPSSSTEYGKIYDTLVFREIEKSKKKQDDGELVLIMNGQEDLLKKPILKTYDITREKGKNFIAIRGLSARLQQLNREYTKDKEPTTKFLFYPFI